MPESPNKLLNNDHGNYVYATYTGHIFDTTLDIYFCEARFYDASTRTWMAMDPVKDGGNWYQYCYGNPLKYWDPLGLWSKISVSSAFDKFSGCENKVYYMQNLDGAMWMGHSALLLVNEDGEGIFLSFMAADDMFKVYLGRKSKSHLAVLSGDADEVLDLLETGDIKSEEEGVDDNYDRIIWRNTGYTSVERILEVAETYSNMPYYLLKRNCGTFVLDALKSADGNLKDVKSAIIPNAQRSRFLEKMSDQWNQESIGKDTPVEKVLEWAY